MSGLFVIQAYVPQLGTVVFYFIILRKATSCSVK